MASNRTSQLERLPSELSSLIVDQLSAFDLAQVRLVSRHLSTIATCPLFRNVALLPTLPSVRRFRSVLSCKQLAVMVKNVKLYTFEYPEMQDGGSNDSDDGEDHEPTRHRGNGYEQAMQMLNGFSNLDSVIVVFTQDCSTEGWWNHGPVPENKNDRHHTLTKIFGTFHNLAIYPRCLVIKHLQNFPDEKLTQSEAFQTTLENLAELHIHVAPEYCHEFPEENRNLVELKTFYPHLRSKWLEPVAAQLTSLSLYNVYKWGLVPGYADMHGLAFPALQKLALGNYAVGYDDQIDWILEQTTLQELILHDCGIACLLIFEDHHWDNWRPSVRNWIEVPRPEGEFERAFRYNGTWESIFDQIRGKLRRLYRFSFDYIKSPDKLDVLCRVPQDNKLDSQRYMFFWSGAGDEFDDILVAHEWESSEQFQLSTQRNEDTLLGDARALWELVETVDQRAGGVQVGVRL